MKQKLYTGSVYIGVVGPEEENGECRDSIERMVRRNGDAGPFFIRATKGYEARQLHLNTWYSNTQHPFMLLLDHDQILPPDALEQLRSHKLPYVSGYYLRRRYSPLAPVWFKAPKRNDDWPREPWLDEPARGQLHQLGGSGWGCLLIHRDVVTATKPLLKGEPEIIEDDMDVYPYDLAALMSALMGLRHIADAKPEGSILFPALDHHLSVLESEIRPLRCLKNPIGSDIRYPFFAREAGFTLYGDPDVRVGHMLNYPLVPDDYTGVPVESKAEVKKQTYANIQKEHQEILRQRAVMRGAK